MEIGKKITDKGAEMIKGLLEAYRGQINDAWKDTDDMAVNFNLKFKPGSQADEIDLEAGISFTTGKVKDKITQTINERQLNLAI
jgi:hypothetical protein